jgi:hypothetical protein
MAENSIYLQWEHVDRRVFVAIALHIVHCQVQMHPHYWHVTVCRLI